MKMAKGIGCYIAETLPVGTYKGYWCGNKAEVKFNDMLYVITTDLYVKGINIPVNVEVTIDGITVDVI